MEDLRRQDAMRIEELNQIYLEKSYALNLAEDERNRATQQLEMHRDLDPTTSTRHYSQDYGNADSDEIWFEREMFFKSDNECG